MVNFNFAFLLAVNFFGFYLIIYIKIINIYQVKVEQSQPRLFFFNQSEGFKTVE